MPKGPKNMTDLRKRLDEAISDDGHMFDAVAKLLTDRYGDDAEVIPGMVRISPLGDGSYIEVTVEDGTITATLLSMADDGYDSKIQQSFRTMKKLPTWIDIMRKFDRSLRSS